ncbi:MAG TPA: hypothetical protein VIY86_14135, partial [Pirellulaceae bacterium]
WMRAGEASTHRSCSLGEEDRLSPAVFQGAEIGSCSILPQVEIVGFRPVASGPSKGRDRLHEILLGRDDTYIGQGPTVRFQAPGRESNQRGW